MSRLFRHFAFRWFVVAPLMLVAFVASALFVTFHVVHAASVPKRVAVEAELDAADPGWRAADLNAARNAKLPPPDENAAELAFLAQQKIPKAYREWDGRAESSRWRDDLTAPHLPHRADVAELRTHLRTAKEAVDAARALRTVPGGGFPLEFKEPNPLNTLLPKQQEVRQTFRLLSSDALVRAYDRRYDEALDSCLAILAAARGFGDEPLFISQLVRMSGVAISVSSTERTLAWGDGFDDARLAALDKAFEKEAGEPRLVSGLRGERATFDRLCANLDSGAMSMSHLSDGKPNLWEDLMASPYRARLPEEHAVGLTMYAEMIAAAGTPGPTRTARLWAIEDKYFRLARGPGRPLPRYILIGLLMPAVDKMNEADTRTTAWVNAARVAIACERHRAKTGAYPETLADLPKELLAEVPTDPFSGNPILYKKLPDGAAAYSVGADGVDDGAEKLDPKRAKGNDLGFRLWTPEHRRQPPEPKSNLYSPPGLGFSIDLSDKPRDDAPTAPPPLSPWTKKE